MAPRASRRYIGMDVKKLIVTVAVATIALGVLTYLAPRIALVLVGVGVAALLIRSSGRNTPIIPPSRVERQEVPTPEEPTSSESRTPDRVLGAVNMARRELGQPESSVGGDIEAMTPLGRCVVRVGYQSDNPFIAVRQGLGDATEMAFVVRRHHSVLGLPRLVDNTPIDTANIEYRLRRMQLPGSLSSAFDAATNRPRLFRELLEHGMDRALQSAQYDARFRLEDVIYGGDSMTVVLHPAADPGDAAYLRDALLFARPFCEEMQDFLAEVPVTSAQS